MATKTTLFVDADGRPDSERFLTRDDRGIWIVNSSTKASKLIVTVGGYAVGQSIGVTRDGRWITYTETGTKGEIMRAPNAHRYFSSTAIRSAGCPEAFSSACFAAPAMRTSSAFAPAWSFR